ncbi:MAG: DotI/IcmL/TraM family protein [Gammaproteobacteria bacterium]
MALDAVRAKYIPRNNDFYRRYYHWFIIGLMGVILLLVIAVGFVMFQLFHRPLPAFLAKQADGKVMALKAYDEPNLLPDTILRWASKAATSAYTFDFVNYDKQISGVRPYFTPAGWNDFQSSISRVVATIVQDQLFVSGVVAGIPVISNQGPLPDKGYTWRVQIPFLVTYQSANTTSKRNYYVIITIVHVPTSQNPQGIGIDQFVMV